MGRFLWYSSRVSANPDPKPNFSSAEGQSVCYSTDGCRGRMIDQVGPVSSAFGGLVCMYVCVTGNDTFGVKMTNKIFRGSGHLPNLGLPTNLNAFYSLRSEHSFNTIEGHEPDPNN